MMPREYDIGNPSDMNRFTRDLERAVGGEARDGIRKLQRVAAVRCPQHGELTRAVETDPKTGEFKIEGCCDAAVKRAEQAVAQNLR